MTTIGRRNFIKGASGLALAGSLPKMAFAQEKWRLLIVSPRSRAGRSGYFP